MIIFIAVSFYGYESSNIVSMKKEKMQNMALTLSSKIISSYMLSQPLKIENIEDYEMALYDENKTLIYGGDFAKVEFKQGFWEDDKFDYFTDLSPQLHHGVKYLVLKSKKRDEVFLKT